MPNHGGPEAWAINVEVMIQDPAMPRDAQPDGDQGTRHLRVRDATQEIEYL